MTSVQSILRELIDLSRALGHKDRELAILGEGNTSADCSDGTFYVKASGSSLASLEQSGVSRVRSQPVLELLEGEELAEEEIEHELMAALADPTHRKPSVETFLHATCLRDGGARWVAHTHPVSINRILCSTLGAEPFLRHIFPDAIVVCGKVPAVVPYTDPGFALAKAVCLELRRYSDAHGSPPKLLLLVNHGAVALGESAKEAMNIMLMADKWATILWGTHALSGPRYLLESEVERIDTRLDEHYRRRELSRKQGHNGS